ncbi:MAG: hypothetical protein WC511_05515 [Candidatus Pacearchaeota archaeon]
MPLKYSSHNVMLWGDSLPEEVWFSGDIMFGIKIFGRLFFLPSVKDVDEARNAYYHFTGKNCPRRAYALQEWTKLYLPLVQKAIQDKDVDAFFELFSSYKMPPEGKAWDEAIAVGESFVSRISTPQQADKAHQRQVSHNCYSSRNEGPYAQSIRKKWDELSAPEIEAANSIPEIKTAVDNSFHGSKLFIVGMLKWADTCHTVDEIKELTSYALTLSCPKADTSVVEIIREKAVSILLIETPKVIDIKTIKSYYHFAPQKSAVKIFIFERWLELCTTPEQANEAFIYAPEERVVCQLGAYKKMQALLSTKT